MTGDGHDEQPDPATDSAIDDGPDPATDSADDNGPECEALDDATLAGLDRSLGAARPGTFADHGWARSRAGVDALAAIAEAAQREPDRGLRIRIPRTAAGPRLRRPAIIGVGLVAAATLATTLAVSLSGSDPRHPVAQSPTVRSTPATNGPRPADMALVGFDSCAAALNGLRLHTAAHVTAYGLGNGGLIHGYGAAPVSNLNTRAADAGLAPMTSAPGPTAPAHSSTNDQEAGADEPDIVKNDGRRIVTVSGGVLRVVDVATRAVSGTLDLTAYVGADSAQLLMSGNRVLVLLGDGNGGSGGGSIYYPTLRGPGPLIPYQPSTGTTVLLVDLAHAQPRIVSMFRPAGTLVDARFVGGTARLVVSSTPRLALKNPPRTARTSDARRADYRAQVAAAPISDWLPSWSVTTGSSSTTHTLDCTDLSHPLGYTGLSMTTVYSADLQDGFGDLAPVSLVAATGEVYATTTSLYVASQRYDAGPRDRTWIHRFDITAHRPAYLGSGSVPGYIQDSYSMSDYAGTLRVVTHDAQVAYGQHADDSRQDLYVLDDATLKGIGHIPDLGRGEQLYAVRLLGEVGYVVTFRRVDPLYVLDLHDPRRPTIAGTLTQSGYSSYLHDVGAGRLLGVGETVDKNDEPDGLQVSLFDVAHPARPTRVAQVTRRTGYGGTTLDPHAFLYWAADDLAVVPLSPDSSAGGGAVLAVRVGRDSLTALGTVTNPGGDDGGITRTLVIGTSLWTFSASGLVASDLMTLHRQAVVSFG